MSEIVAERAAACGGIGALLFDLDGTLVDTMDLHFEAYRRVFEDLHRTFDREEYLAAVGPPAINIIPGFLRALDLDGTIEAATVHHRKKVAFEHVLRDRPARRLPAFDLLVKWRDRAKTAIVTSGNARGVEALARSLGLHSMVDTIVTAEDVDRGKPDPEPFTLALERLGQFPEDAIAFEDNALGIDAAMAAGVATIDVVSGELNVPEKAARTLRT